LARANRIYVAYSNEAFELWYLLHFNYYITAISRQDYMDKLSDLLKYKYEKNSEIMYKELKNKQKKAIQHAKKLYSTYEPNHNPEKNNPCTTVFRLVERLNEFWGN